MPTSYDITQAISLGETINTYLCSAKIDKYGIGSRENADQYCRDYVTVTALLDILYFYNLNGSDTELTQDQISDAIYKIHEYDYAQLLDIEDFSVQVGSESDALGTGESVIVLKSGTILPTPQSYTWIVENDGDDTFQVPFNIVSVDSDSITLILNDSDPIFDDSYTIAGTTLSWIGEYPLSSGWKFEIKWWGIDTELPS